MFLKLLILAISIIQFSVCKPTSNGSSQCLFVNKFDERSVEVDCEGAAFHPSICDHLKDDVLIVSIVLIKNCEISEYSDINNKFPNMIALGFIVNNTLPSANFSIFSHLSAFHIEISKLNPSTESSITISMNATNLERLSFYGTLKNNISSISLANALKLEDFDLKNTMISSLPADLFKESSHLKRVHIRKNEIENIDTMNWPNSVRMIDFSSNKISHLTKNSFQNLTDLRELGLNGNKIDQIGAETFAQLNNLTDLKLNKNAIKAITKNMLNGLNNLVVVNFANNDINFIESGAFESTSNLCFLNLGNNNISSLNQQMFGGFNNLMILGLDATPIRELTAESFGNLLNLKVLLMRAGMLEKVDFNAFANLPSLGHVNLANNRISQLVKMAPNTSWNATEKTHITFPFNFFYFFVEVDTDWTKMVPTEAGQFKSEDLKYHFCGQSESDFGGLVGDQIFNICNGFSDNTKLIKMILSQNQLTEIEKDIFAEFKTLKVLFLSHNPITTLYPESFAGLNDLESLHLDGCKLTSVDFSMFTHLTKLKQLDLSNNQLTTIATASMPSIVRLDLNDNQLNELPVKKSDLPNLKTFNVLNNNLTCSIFDKSFADIQFFCYLEN